MSLTPNQQVFEYRIEHLIAEGPFGTVWLAYEPVIGYPVAIKEITTTTHTDEIAFKRLLRDAQAARAICSPYVVRFHGLRVSTPNVYLITEFLPGGSVRALIEERGPLAVADAIQIASDVCEGLAAAHAEGLVHGDLKPENVLLSEDGRAKVGDFGMAHLPCGAGGTYRSELAGRKHYLEMLRYRSPEQLHGRKAHESSDVYQAGALLHEMLTGQHHIDVDTLEQRGRADAGLDIEPFQARLHRLLAEAIRDGEVPPIHQALPEAPKRLEETLALALSPEMQDRPTAATLGQLLRTQELLEADLDTWKRSVQTLCAQDHFKRGVKSKRKKDWEQAIAQFEQAAQINPGYTEVHLELGEAYSELGDPENAEAAYQSAALGPDPATAYLKLADLYESQGASDRIADVLQQAIRVDPDSVRRHYHSHLPIDRNSYHRVVAAYQRAAASDPSSASIHYNLGRVLARSLFEPTGQKRALVEYEQAISLRPNYPEAFVAIGNAYLELQLPDEALGNFQRATTMEWTIGKRRSDFTGSLNRVDAHLGLARTFIRLGQFDEANAAAQLVQDMTPDQAIWLDVLEECSEHGKTLLDQGEPRLARDAFRMVVSIYSDFPREQALQFFSDKWAYAYRWVALSSYQLALQELDGGHFSDAVTLLDAALEALEAGSLLFTHQGQEVSNTWVDLRARIETAQRTAHRLY